MHPSIIWSLALYGSLICTASAKRVRWYSFGDSYSDTGFNPNATIDAEHPMGKLTLDPHGYVNYIYFLTTQLNKTVVYNANNAKSGATVNGTLSQNKENDLDHQLRNFMLTKGMPRFKPHDATLASFWFGTNDIDIGVQEKFDRDSYLSRVMSSYRMGIEAMCLTNVTHILLMNAPNVTRTPSVAKLYRNNDTRLHEHALMNIEFNQKFRAMYEDLKSNCTDVKVYHYDTFSFFDKVLDDPKNYGFKNATCVDDAEEQKGFDLEAYKKGLTCPWRNDLHPGRKFNYWLAKDIAENVFPELGLWK